MCELCFLASTLQVRAVQLEQLWMTLGVEAVWIVYEMSTHRSSSRCHVRNDREPLGSNTNNAQGLERLTLRVNAKMKGPIT